ncbi:MAG: hypothetical protein JKY48_05710 [Flavobacteriales bacterium]|nr:hypothetical protein [Flavobacteriales bacterium]
MKKYASLIGFLVLLFACSSTEENSDQSKKYGLHLIDSLEFETNFSFTDRPSGSFYDQETKQTCYYFGNLSTDKVLKVFSETGEQLYVVQLDSVQKETRIEEVEIWSMDTILVLSQYDGQLFFLNKKGEVWKQVNLLALLGIDSVWYTELSSSYFSKMNVTNSSIVLGLNAAIQPAFQSEKGIQFYTEKVWSKPQFVRFDSIFSDSILAIKGFPMYQCISPEDSSLLNIELKSFVITNDAIYTHSYYSDQVFELDVKTLELQKKYQLQSAYKRLAARVNTKAKSDGEIGSLMYKSAGGGMIARHFFNEWLQQHYFVISIDREYWSLLVYDQTFNRIAEHKYSDKEYQSYILPSKKGFYLQKLAGATQKYHDQKLTFHEFAY